MNITAEQIQKSCTGTQLLNQEVKTILQAFQEEIIEAGKNGSTNVSIPVPSNYNIASMDNKTAQTIIYNRLIEELEERGFTVIIQPKKSVFYYNNRWDVKKKGGDLTKMQTSIARHIEQTGKPKKK
jgi:hypothetical protein